MSKRRPSVVGKVTSSICEARQLYASDPRRFCKIVRLAQSTVLRQKQDPKPDRQSARRISRAARKLALGAKCPELYERFLPVGRN